LITLKPVYNADIYLWRFSTIFTNSYGKRRQEHKKEKVVYSVVIGYKICKEKNGKAEIHYSLLLNCLKVALMKLSAPFHHMSHRLPILHKDLFCQDMKLTRSHNKNLNCKQPTWDPINKSRKQHLIQQQQQQQQSLHANFRGCLHESFNSSSKSQILNQVNNYCIIFNCLHTCSFRPTCSPHCYINCDPISHRTSIFI